MSGNAEVERLANEVGSLFAAIKTEAIRGARLRARRGKAGGRMGLREYLEQNVSSAIVAIHLRQSTLFKAEVAPFSKQHIDSTAAAFVRFGRGRHPAALNFGDCMPDAFASTAGVPLLFAGEDFSRTDIAHA